VAAATRCMPGHAGPQQHAVSIPFFFAIHLFRVLALLLRATSDHTVGLTIKGREPLLDRKKDGGIATEEGQANPSACGSAVWGRCAARPLFFLFFLPPPEMELPLLPPSIPPPLAPLELRSYRPLNPFLPRRGGEPQRMESIHNVHGAFGDGNLARSSAAGGWQG
jgi:hypothetical protein